MANPYKVEYPYSGVPVDMAWMCEQIGWRTLTALSDTLFDVERSPSGEPCGLSLDLTHGWWLVALRSETGFRVGKYRAMIPYGWLDVTDREISWALMRAAVTAAPWPPTDAEP